MKNILKVTAVIFVVTGLAGCSGLTQGSESTPYAVATMVDPIVVEKKVHDPNAWPPYGFTEEIPGVSFRWAPIPARVICADFAPSCFGVEISTNTSCPSGIFIELALVDSQGIIRGKVNEITAAMIPGERAELIINSAEESPKARLTQLNCLQ